jgi:transcriptional regulator with PAS, ATPase and Fis domain/tetratricopeptide (TPR) repeat protein
MFADFLQRLADSQDKFAFVLSEPLLHSASSDVEALREFYQSIEATSLEDNERSAVQLAALFVSRRHIDLRAAPWTDLIERCAQSQDQRTRIHACITRGAILSSLGETRLANDEFAKCIAATRATDDHFSYALACKGFADSAMILGLGNQAEVAYENALVTFRRYDMDLLAAFVTNNLGVLHRRQSDHVTSLRLFAFARSVFQKHGVLLSELDSTKNLGIACFRLGDWKAARRWFQAASELHARLRASQSSDVRWAMGTVLQHLLIVQRRFDRAEQGLLEMLTCDGIPPRENALIHEFLGEIYVERGETEKAAGHLGMANEIAEARLPLSDVMTETLRRQAQLLLCQEKFDDARVTALHCINLAKRIGDRYESGAALRVLGEVYAAQGMASRADASFKVAVGTLKSIHECYELMRALYAQGKFLAKTGKADEAEIALLEARQLSKKLELEYYQALIAIAMTDTLGPQERFEEAQTWLYEATTLRDHLEAVDRERVETELRRSANDLQTLITRASVKSAEKLKTICRVYEDARFPFEDMRADLAYQVAQSINAESLFVVGKSGTGYRVPITYNISTNESKEIVRRLERILHSKTLLNIADEPRILTTIEGRALLVVPCREDEALARSKKNGDRYVACARFENGSQPGPRQIELFCASSEALARLIEDEELRPARKSGTANHGVTDDDAELESSPPRHPRGAFSTILTIDSDMIKLIRTAERAAGSVAPILLEGETGVGKELFARAIHGASQRKDGPFVAINAGGMSVHLLESELFGHVKGAFTDAGTDRTGLVDTARGGTLFFDEVGEMGEEMQVKLLRLMENGEYRRLGESSMRKADVRVVSATNRDLKKDAERGLFRRDLYYRLSPLKLTVPPLRMRASDIQLLTRYFLRECATMNGIGDRYIEMDVKTMEALELYDWPGNVRELHNEILRVVSLIGRGDLVRFAMLSENIKDFLKSKKRGDGLLDRSVEQYERRLILEALEKNDWNKLRTADAIGIPRTTLLAKLKRINIATKL